MSRIGKLPVAVPQGVKVALTAGVLSIEGPVGKMQYKPAMGTEVSIENGKVLVKKVGNTKQAECNYGTSRALINQMIAGVSKGWKRSLELSGVGYVAKVAGPNLVLDVGLSHEVNLEIPKTVKCVVTKNLIELESCNREVVGTFAAKIRKVQPPEPYLGKGIKYSEETIRRKAGKAGKK